MNPNRLNRELRNVPGNVHSPRFPGGTLVSAVFDRRLMGWSDRGGASRMFGDVWSEYCWTYLSNTSSIFSERDRAQKEHQLIRLDDDPRIAIQAGRNQLSNPDFLVLTTNGEGVSTLRAIDAKFAVDRLRRTQISAKSIQSLIELPGSLAYQAISDSTKDAGEVRLSFRDGQFLGPRSLINSYFRDRLTSGDEPAIDPSELLLVEVNADRLFGPIEGFEVTEFLRSIDDVSRQSDDVEIVIGMYYVRLACAARWFETQRVTPLLGEAPSTEISSAEVLDEARRRLDRHKSAFSLIEDWSSTAERSAERQKRIREAARLPIRMSEIRKMVERAGFAKDPKAARLVRRTLEQYFSRRLVDEVGVIPANPGKPFSEVLEHVSTGSRKLRSEMLTYAEKAVSQLDSTIPASDSDE